ncbi:NfeD family protein [Desulfotignum phosphitoxidans]|uniref:NfeD-like membrane-bound serine protease n=1 Tax=Desulfotignum phosphitoxidans DSM 13687 TaxID=1286635 RepID=S0G3X1_9BACT|nr:NfeD family protein [Desulfotignum phosphitoxidans]EMS78982.1 NfeD-like membrane-bound serine protease [Desulfotignum phosphitoxidans DSM 13687]
MTSYLFPILLQVLGLMVIVVEIFVPSLGILAVTAAGILFYSLYLVFTTISFTAGMVFLGVDILMIPFILVLGFKALGASSLSLHKKLSSREGVSSQAPDLVSWKGKKGEAITDLRPSGTVMIEGKRLDAVTDGEYVDAGTPVVVTLVSGNRIVVDKNE